MTEAANKVQTAQVARFEKEDDKSNVNRTARVAGKEVGYGTGLEVTPLIDRRCGAFSGFGCERFAKEIRKIVPILLNILAWILTVTV